MGNCPPHPVMDWDMAFVFFIFTMITMIVSLTLFLAMTSMQKYFFTTKRLVAALGFLFSGIQFLIIFAHRVGVQWDRVNESSQITGSVAVFLLIGVLIIVAGHILPDAQDRPGHREFLQKRLERIEAAKAALDAGTTLEEIEERRARVVVELRPVADLSVSPVRHPRMSTG